MGGNCPLPLNLWLRHCFQVYDTHSVDIDNSKYNTMSNVAHAQECVSSCFQLKIQNTLKYMQSI